MEEYQKAIDLDNDPRYGNITVFFHRKNPNLKCYQLKRKFPTKEQYENELNFLDERINFNNTLIKLIDFSEDAQN